MIWNARYGASMFVFCFWKIFSLSFLATGFDFFWRDLLRVDWVCWQTKNFNLLKNYFLLIFPSDLIINQTLEILLMKTANKQSIQFAPQSSEKIIETGK